MDEKRSNRSVLKWAAGVGVACFAASMVIAIPLDLIVGEGNKPIEQLAMKDPGFLVALLLLMPFVETLFGQWLPIALTGIFTRSPVPKVVVSSILFAALHISNSWTNAVVVLLIAGPVFATTFVRFREESRWKAYLATSLTHMVHNLLAAILILATR